MERFEEFKKIILERARAAEACREQYGRAYKAEDFPQLMEVIRDNFHWATRHTVIDGDLIDTYKEEFNEGKIWHNEDVRDGFLLAYGSSTVRAYGSSTVEAYGSSTVRAYGSSTVEACDSSTVRAYDSSYICSYDVFECQLSDHAVWRISRTNTIRYADPSMVFERVCPESKAQ